MEIRIKCKKEFELERVEGTLSGMVIKKGQSGVALKHALANGEYFYTCEVSGCMFDMRHSSFEKYMIEIH